VLLFEVRMKDLVIYAQEQFFPSGHDMKGTYLKRPTVSETYRVAVQKTYRFRRVYAETLQRALCVN
jgi:hypothetical protein